MKKVELKPCPFCGSDEIRLTENCSDDPAWSLTTIVCKKCGSSSTRAMRTTEKAVEWWNTRQNKDRESLEGLVYLALKHPIISISKGRELLGFEFMEDMRDWLRKYRESVGAKGEIDEKGKSLY